MMAYDRAMAERDSWGILRRQNPSHMETDWMWREGEGRHERDCWISGLAVGWMVL